MQSMKGELLSHRTCLLSGLKSVSYSVSHFALLLERPQNLVVLCFGIIVQLQFTSMFVQACRKGVVSDKDLGHME